jgi:hypothetical protein
MKFQEFQEKFLKLKKILEFQYGFLEFQLNLEGLFLEILTRHPI